MVYIKNILAFSPGPRITCSPSVNSLEIYQSSDNLGKYRP